MHRLHNAHAVPAHAATSAWYIAGMAGGVSLRSAMQVDVFSFGVIIYELLARQVTSAVVSQAGDMTMPEMYAQKVSHMYSMHAAASQHSSQQ